MRFRTEDREQKTRNEVRGDARWETREWRHELMNVEEMEDNDLKRKMENGH